MNRNVLKTVPQIADYGTVEPGSLHNDAALRVVSKAPPTIVNGTVNKTTRTKPPKRLKNAVLRPREYLTAIEVEKLIQAARQRGRYGVRDAAMILIAYQHGLRVGELCALRWDAVDFEEGMLHVSRLKNGRPSVHPLRGPELRALRQMRRENAPSAYVFNTERAGPMSTAGFRKLLARTGAAAGFDFGVHPHMLRHACCYKLANDGQDTRAIQDFLGHKNVSSTRCAARTYHMNGMTPTKAEKQAAQEKRAEQYRKQSDGR